MTDWRWLAPTVLLALWAPSAAASPSSALEQRVAERVQEVMDDWSAPGAVVAVLQEGALTLGRGYGVEDVESARQVEFSRTSFRLASLSKPVTAAAALRLHERGSLDLRASLAPSLPALSLDPRLQMHHLLTHTAGFEDRMLLRLSRDASAVPPLSQFLARNLPPARFEPGELSIYSNHGMALAGLAIAEAAGRSFEEAMQALVFRPLGMERSTFQLSRARDLAGGHTAGRPAPTYGINTVPSSMLVSTGADMARFLEALLRPESSDFLKPATVDLMLSRQFGHHPALTGRAYGWSEDSSVTPRRLLHSGGTDGFSSAIVLVPEQRGAIFVALNGNAWVWGLVRELLEELFPATPAPPRPTAAVIPPVPGVYAPAGLPTGTMDKARLLFEQRRLDAPAPERLRFGDVSYTATEDGLWTSSRGVLVPHTSAAGNSFLFEEGEAWSRIPWHAGRTLHATAFVTLVLLLIALLLGRPQRLFGAIGPPVALRAAAGLQLAQVMALGAFIGASMAARGGTLRFEIPVWLHGLLWLPIVALLVGLLGAWSVRARGRHVWGPALASCLVLAGWVAWLSYWRLLGVHA